MQRWLGILGVIASAWLAGSVGGAHAQDAEPRPAEGAGPALNWTRQPGAESCIASVELAARIEARVKRRIFVPAPEAIVAIEGYVAPEPSGGFRAVIAMSDGQGLLYGSRELRTSGACAELDDGLVFVIAVTLRPESGAGGIALPENVALALDALFGAEPTEPDPAAFPNAPAQSEGDAPPAKRAVSPPRRVASTSGPTGGEDVRAFIEPHGALHLGLQPGVGVGGGVGLRVRLSRIGSFSLAGSFFAKTTQRVIDGSIEDGRASDTDFTVRMISLGYCTPVLLGDRAFGLEAYAAGRFGEVASETDDFDIIAQASGSPFVAAGLGARLAVELNDNVVIALAAGPEVRLARPVFQYQPARGEPASVFKVSSLGGAAELSVGFALF